MRDEDEARKKLKRRKKRRKEKATKKASAAAAAGGGGHESDEEGEEGGAADEDDAVKVRPFRGGGWGWASRPAGENRDCFRRTGGGGRGRTPDPHGLAAQGSHPPPHVQASDELEAAQSVSSKAKIRAFCFAPAGAKLPAGVACRLVLALANNMLEVCVCGGGGGLGAAGGGGWPRLAGPGGTCRWCGPAACV